jgi:FHA domain
MPICPKGHNSATNDYCDECGVPIGVPAVPGEPAVTSAGEPAAGVETCPMCGSPRIGRFCEEDGYDFVLRPPVSPASSAGLTGASASSAGLTGASASSAGLAGASASSARGAVGPPTHGRPTIEPGASTPSRPAPVAPEPAAASSWVAVVTADREYYETIIAQNGPDAASIVFPAVCPERRIQLTGSQIVIGRHSTSRGLNPEIDLSGPPEDPGVSHLHAVLQSTSDGGWTITDPGSTNGTTINEETQPIEVGVPVPIRPGDRIHVGAWTTLTLIPQL